jgi:hypothetical protein
MSAGVVREELLMTKRRPIPLAYFFESLVLGALLLTAASAHAQLDFKILGDFDYLYRHNSVANSLPSGNGQDINSFQIESVELFPTWQVGKASFLAEIEYEPSFLSNNFTFDIERIEVDYLVADWLRLKMGRFHAAFGYYNDAYHHGKYFMLAEERPIAENFEDSGGLLPVHMIGAAADGRLKLGDFGALRWDLNVGNARGFTSEVVNGLDYSNFKAVNVRLRFEPRFLDGLVFGVNGAEDEILATTGAYLGPGSSGPGVPNNISELIFGAHAAYLEHDIHFIAEYWYLIHNEDSTQKQYITQDAFAEVGYSLGDFTPYFRYEWVQLPIGGDPFFTQIATILDAMNPLGTAGLTGTTEDVRAGLRWLINDNFGAKIELQSRFYENGSYELTGQTQLCFVF